MARWIDALAKTRKTLTGGFGKWLRGGGELDADSLEAMEELLVRADVAPRLAMQWMEWMEGNRPGRAQTHRSQLRALMQETLKEETGFTWSRATDPLALLVVGVNGSGKTTTCAKLAWQARHHDRTPLLCAADTYRAAGSEQLKIWAQDVGSDVVAGATGADAAAVVFDAMAAAEARRNDTLIIDTAGRMHTRRPLMQELEKVRRAMAKKRPGAPEETWVVLDAAMGQNAIAQAQVFHHSTPLTGAVIAKLDGSSKAGFIFSVHRDLGIPVRMVGLGEGKEDLVPFDAQAFVEALIPEENDG
jgi:fused signal recognition particle receptor